MATGLTLGLLLICLGRALFRVRLPTWATAHVVLVAPTALQPWLQRKPYKIAARTLLGVASATWLAGALVCQHLSMWLPFELMLSAGVFGAVARVLLWVRDAKTVSPCTSCPLGYYPTCSWNLPRVLDGLDDQELARALSGAVEAGYVITAATPVVDGMNLC